jgi:hypothetical protein
MSILDDIAADLMDERQARAELRADEWRYGTADPARLRAVHEYEAELYPESTLRCGGCKRRISVALLVSCLECGKSVCATCDPSCPHTPDPDALRRSAIRYTVARDVRRGL